MKLVGLVRKLVGGPVTLKNVAERLAGADPVETWLRDQVTNHLARMVGDDGKERQIATTRIEIAGGVVWKLRILAERER